jgi:hypothetical protein
VQVRLNAYTRPRGKLLAAVAEQFVCRGRLPAGEYGAEWGEATRVRATIDRFRATLQDPDGLWTGRG